MKSSTHPVEFKQVRKLQLKKPLKIVAFIAHPVNQRYLLAITSTSLLVIGLHGECISISGQQTDWCVRTEIGGHDRFGQLTQIYLPNSHLRSVANLSSHEVLLVDKENHCIHKYNLKESRLHTFIGVCGGEESEHSFMERQLQYLKFDKPICMSYVILQSVGHLLIENDESETYVVRFESSQVITYKLIGSFLGSGRILLPSNSSIISIISGRTSHSNKQCWIRQSYKEQVSTQYVDCNLTIINLKEIGIIVLTHSKIYMYDPNIVGDFFAHLEDMNFPLSITLMAMGADSQLIAYSETDKQFVTITAGYINKGGRPSKISWQLGLSANHRLINTNTLHHTTMEACCYTCSKRDVCSGFRYSIDIGTCETFESLELVDMTSNRDDSNLYLKYT